MELERIKLLEELLLEYHEITYFPFNGTVTERFRAHNLVSGEFTKTTRTEGDDEVHGKVAARTDKGARK